MAQHNCDSEINNYTPSVPNYRGSLFVQNQTILSLTKFIENNDKKYDIK